MVCASVSSENPLQSQSSGILTKKSILTKDMHKNVPNRKKRKQGGRKHKSRRMKEAELLGDIFGVVVIVVVVDGDCTDVAKKGTPSKSRYTEEERQAGKRQKQVRFF